MNENEPTEENLGYRKNDEEYSKLKKDLVKSINRRNKWHSKVKKRKWASDMTSLLRRHEPEDAKLMHELFLTGVEELKKEDDLERLKNLLPWLVSVYHRTRAVLNAMDATESQHRGFTVLLHKFAETLDVTVFGGRNETIPVSFPSSSELDGLRDHFAKKIFRYYYDLRKIINHYEETISDRWNKYGLDKRENILSSNWEETYQDEPELQGTKNINTSSRMDIAMLLGFVPYEARGSHNQWPYISTTDLGNKNTRFFLMMLHSRANSPPGSFWGLDYLSTVNSSTSGTFYLSWLPTDDVFVFAGEKFNTPEKYGRFVSKQRILTTGRSSCGLDGGGGLLVMKVQARLYEFLVGCCSTLLQHEMTLHPLEDLPDSPDSPPAPIPRESIRRDIYDPPYYRIPAVIEDFTEMIETVERRYDHVYEELIALRDSPVKFHSALHELAEHNLYKLKDRKRGEQTYDSAEFWKITVSCFIFLSIGIPMIWSTIIDALKDVQETLSRNPDYAQKDVLPSELREALLRLSGCLSDVMDLFTQHTYESTVCSAPLRNHFSALPKEESQGRRPRRYELLGPELAIESRGPVDETSNWGILYKTISTIWFHGEPIVYGPLMIEMDRRMREDKNLKKTMTPYVRERLNDIVLCSHCHAQMQRFQPWAVSSNFNILVPDEADNSNTSNDDDDPEAPKLSDDHFRTELVWLEYDAKQELEGLDIQTLLKGFLNPDLDYSVENLLTNPSEAQTVKNQTLERTLDDFWAKIDGGLGQKLSQRSDLPLDQVFPIAGPFRFRTPDWDEEAVNAAMRKRAEKARTPEKKRKRYESFTGGPTTGRKILKLVAQHKKQKTRPDPSGNIAQGGQEVATAEEVEEVQIFELDDRNMDVVPQLWQTGEVAPRLAWKDLRRFMQDLGFEETHVEGSIWKFDAGPSDKLKERGITGSINIHDPHAVKFEDRERPHAIGSRLFKLWGWRPESFVEKGGMDELLRD